VSELELTKDHIRRFFEANYLSTPHPHPKIKKKRKQTNEQISKQNERTYRSLLRVSAD